MSKKINNVFREKINKPLIITAFSLFITILIWIIIFKAIGPTFQYHSIKGIKGQITSNINKNIIDRFNLQWSYHIISKTFLIDIIPNILIFIPFGLFLSIINKNKFLSNLFITIGSLFIVELLLFSFYYIKYSINNLCLY